MSNNTARLAREWATSTLPKGDAKTLAAIEHILATTPEPTMAGAEWSDEKHHLAGAVYEYEGSTCPVVMVGETRDGEIYSVDLDENAGFWPMPEVSPGLWSATGATGHGGSPPGGKRKTTPTAWPAPASTCCRVPLRCPTTRARLSGTSVNGLDCPTPQHGRRARSMTVAVARLGDISKGTCQSVGNTGDHSPWRCSHSQNRRARMSTVEVEFREATCPRCGALASEYFERYLQPGEIPFFGICYCDVPLVYEKVTCYQAVCDHCGEHVTEYDQWSALTPESWLWDSLPDWQHIDGRDLCPGCWFINDNDEIEELCRE